ncbi:hypothetical protein AVEN_158167-1 [Araneus ventricosus]|uniref:Uncharacterized protein n=1 Tax=Araneus ventricosus TaxID=182803 RepID=A0A4Y2NC83_ARAVE|nr:hypothetical protein AVEN_158167-1 [Araneus ventricosus]
MILGGGCWDVEYKCELRLDWRNQGREERVLPQESIDSSVCRRDGIHSGGRGLGGSERPIVLFDASVNYKPKSIDLNRLKQTGLLSSGMIGLPLNAQLKVS